MMIVTAVVDDLLSPRTRVIFRASSFARSLFRACLRSSATQHLEPHIKAEMARACVAEYEKMSSLSVRFNLLLKVASRDDASPMIRSDTCAFHTERI